MVMLERVAILYCTMNASLPPNISWCGLGEGNCSCAVHASTIQTVRRPVVFEACLRSELPEFVALFVVDDRRLVIANCIVRSGTHNFWNICGLSLCSSSSCSPDPRKSEVFRAVKYHRVRVKCG